MQKYQQLRFKVSQVITKAKLEYYQNKVAITRSKDPLKWFKSIYSISGASEDTSKSTTPTPEDLYTVVESLQDIFTKPWKDHVPALSLINPEGLPDNSHRVPSIGQVKKLLIELNSKKSTGSGADPGFFLGGVALVSCSTSTPINHIVFFCRIPVVLENRRSSRGGGGCVPPAPSP